MALQGKRRAIWLRMWKERPTSCDVWFFGGLIASDEKDGLPRLASKHGKSARANRGYVKVCRVYTSGRPIVVIAPPPQLRVP